MSGMPEFRVPDLCNARLILHTISGDAVRLLSDLPGGPANCHGREAGTNAARELHERRLERETDRGGWWDDHWFAAPEEIKVSIGQRAQGVHDTGYHHVGLHRMLATVFYASFSSSIFSRSANADIPIFMVRLRKFITKSNNLRDFKQRLPETVSGNFILPLFEFKFNDERRFLSQPVWRAHIPAGGAGRRRPRG